MEFSLTEEMEYGRGFEGPSSPTSTGEVDSIMSIPAEDLVVKFDVLQHRLVQDGKKKFAVRIFCDFFINW